MRFSGSCNATVRSSTGWRAGLTEEPTVVGSVRPGQGKSPTPFLLGIRTAPGEFGLISSFAMWGVQRPRDVCFDPGIGRTVEKSHEHLRDVLRASGPAAQPWK